jgi:photosystem II stability/assembly factor-like uncharacterized protein
MRLKKFYYVLIILIALLICISIVLKRDSYKKIAEKATNMTFNAEIQSEQYEWLRLRNPATNRIPKNIGAKELEYIKNVNQRNAQKMLSIGKDWISKGPYNIGGRTKALALHVKDENTILAGGVSSGMWKSTDGGSSWKKTTASDQLHSVSCIAQKKVPGKENIWYYGTGEGFPSGRGGSASIPLMTNAFYRGDGIFKSIDNGESWSLLPATVSGTPDATDSFDFVWKLATFGENGLYAATSTGLHKSIDGGISWQHVLDFGENYTSYDIALTSQEICYLAVGGKGIDNGIYRSSDGDNWEDITPVDWPDTTNRSVIAIAPSNENIIYFFADVAHWKQQLRKYEVNSGWSDLSAYLPEGGELTTYGGNMLILYVKPDDENMLFLGTVGLYRSNDGGLSFETIGAFGDFHVDQHAIVFYPSNPKVMIVGNDGGLFKTNDNTAAVEYDPNTGDYHIEWESLNNGYLTTQFYTVAIDHGTPYSEIIIGGTQDNAWLYTHSSDPQIPWGAIFGGGADGGYVAISDGGEYYYTSQAATFAIWRFWFPEGELRWTEVTPTATLGGSLWLPPFILDAHDTRIMYLPWRDQLWRNSDLTEIPFVFPPEPTDVNWTQLENMQVNSISALGMSKAQPRRLYCGSFYGNLFRIDNPHEGQPVPIEITGENLPDWAYIHCIAVDPRDANRLLVVYPNYGIISIYASENGGDTWIPVSGNLEEYPDGSGCGPSVRWISILYVEDKPVYFAGTSLGLFSTTKLDSMNTIWIQEGVESIGNIVIDMIDTRQSDGFVAVATHGNGVYTTYITELPSEISKNIAQYPKMFRLYPPYPNPFNQTTTIKFSIPLAGYVSLKIYNILGEVITTLINYDLSGGEHKITWDARSSASGIYFIHLNYGGNVQTHKVLLQK